MANSGDKPPLKLLSLDGGGIRGLSILIILQYLMKRIDPLKPPKPCEYFDLIGGTSTGGIIALMLGRLQMDVQTCIDKYISLSASAFTPKRHTVSIFGKAKDLWHTKGSYKSENLAEEMKKLVQEQLPDNKSEATLLSPDLKCKVFVCAFTKALNTPVRLRSYTTSDSVDTLSASKCTIWQAARATSAAASFFDPIQIGRQEYVDGATGMNNPVEVVLDEAKSIWPDIITGDRLQCIVSIGTGKPDLKDFGSNVKEVVETLKEIAVETEDTEKRFYRSCQNLGIGGRYFRFNVDQGLAGVSLDEHKRIDKIEAASELYLNNPHVKESLESFLSSTGATASYVSEQTKNDILSWLRCIDNLAYHANAKKHRRVKSTGQWFFDGHLHAWSSSPGTLWWLIAGSGKSVLTSTIIDELQKQSTATTIFYYFSFTEQASQDATAFKHSLLMQLVRSLVRQGQNPQRRFYVPRVFQDLWEKYHQTTQFPPAEDLHSVFNDLLIESKLTYIVVDALDEYRDKVARRDILLFLKDLCRMTNTNTRILVSSRREHDIEEAMKAVTDPQMTIVMDAQTVNADIKTYLRGMMAQPPFRDWPKELKKKVVSRLLAKADGVFRYVALQLLTLMDKYREKDVERGLQELAEDLTESYKLILQRIHHSKQSVTAISMLKWIAYSERPLKLSEVAESAIFEMSSSSPTSDDDYVVSYDPKDRFPNILHIRAILLGLVTIEGIDDSSQISQFRDGIVSFSHFTVLEYLQGKDVEPSIFQLHDKAAHWYIMHSCLGYLYRYDILCEKQQQLDSPVSQRRERESTPGLSDSDSSLDFSDSDTPSQNQDNFKPFPLLSYAAKYWWVHGLHICRMEDDETAESELSEKFTTTINSYKKQTLISSVKVAVAFSPGSSDSSSDISFDTQLDHLSDGLLRNIQGPDSLDRSELDLPTSWITVENLATSSKYDISTIRKWFLASARSKHLLDLNLKFFASAFSSLISEEPISDYDFDLESKNSLHHAALAGDQRLISLLLDGGNEVDCRWSTLRLPFLRPCPTALHIAVQGNKKDIVQILVENGADINASYWSWSEYDSREVSNRAADLTPLMMAASSGFADIVEYLARNGARVDLLQVEEVNHRGWSSKMEQISQTNAVLLGNYGYAPHKANKEWTPLKLEIMRCNQATASVLVDHGADIFRLDNRYACPFSLAIVYGLASLVRTMLYKRKDECLAWRSINGFTALSLAAAHRDTTLVAHLLESGADFNTGDDHHSTAPIICASIGAQQLTRRLIYYGDLTMNRMGESRDALSSPDPDKIGLTRERSAYSTIQLLCSQGCGLGPVGRNSNTPLHHACANGQLESIQALLDNDADIEARNGDGWTPLMVATLSGGKETVKILLDRGANRNE